jgi:hypothetical protein
VRGFKSRQTGKSTTFAAKIRPERHVRALRLI